MSSIGSISSNAMAMHGPRQRPSAAQATEMANALFSKLDTAGQGYLTKADLQSAIDGTSSATSSSSSGTASNVDALFSKLDNNGDGKVTKQEFSDTLKKVADQLDNQVASMRMSGAMPGGGVGGPPPGGPPPGGPPPGGGDGGGMTKDELSSAASDIGSSDSTASSKLADLVKNFDKADTNHDGKVSLQEAATYDQTTASSTSAASTSDSSSTASASDTEVKLMQQIMKLMQAYGIGGEQDSSNPTSTLSVSA